MSNFRSTLFTIFLAVTTVLVATLALPTLVFGRAAASRTIKVWGRIVLFGLRELCGIDYRVEGTQYIPSGGAIVAANHQSMWETIALFVLLEKPVAVFKKELLRIPVYGWWGWAAGSIPIDREAGVRSIRTLTRTAAARIADGSQLILFPEGTRTPLGVRAKLQPGVAAVYVACGVPVTPAAHDSGRFWHHPGPRKTPGVITLRFLPPIAPGLDRKVFIQRLKAALEDARPDLDPNAPAAPDETAPVTGRNRAVA